MKMNNQITDSSNVNTILKRVCSIENQLHYLANLCDVNALRLKEVKRTCVYLLENASLFEAYAGQEGSENCEQHFGNLKGVLKKIELLNKTHLSNLAFIDKYKESIGYVKVICGNYFTMNSENLDKERSNSIEIKLLDVTETLGKNISGIVGTYRNYDDLINKLNEMINVDIFRKCLDMEFMEAK